MVWWIQAKKLASLWQYHCCCQCFCCATTIRVRQGAVSSVCWMAFWEVSPKAQLMPGAWYSAGKGNYWTPATTGLTPSPSFFLDLSAATSSCTRRELSSCPLKQAFSCTPRVPIRWKMQQLLDTEEFQWLWLFQSLSCVCFRQRSVHFSHLYHICFWNWATYRFKVGHHDSCTVSICYISSGKQLHKSLWGQPAFRCAGPPRLDRRT